MNMSTSISKFLISAMAFAEKGSGHTHGDGGETEHLWPVLGIFIVLIVAGVTITLISKKKK